MIALSRAREPRLTECAQAWLARALAPGGRAVDGTAGNGRDTLFLAERVAPGGRVDAFDIQAAALARARRRLAAAGLDPVVRWHRASHDRLGHHIGAACPSAVVFNLGWLPGGDRRIVTRPATTRAALQQTAVRLAPGGRLAVCAYRGHPGGPQEAEAVADWIADGAGGLEALDPLGGGPGRTTPVLFRLRRAVEADPVAAAPADSAVPDSG